MALNSNTGNLKDLGKLSTSKLVESIANSNKELYNKSQEIDPKEYKKVIENVLSPMKQLQDRLKELKTDDLDESIKNKVDTLKDIVEPIGDLVKKLEEIEPHSIGDFKELTDSLTSVIMNVNTMKTQITGDDFSAIDNILGGLSNISNSASGASKNLNVLSGSVNDVSNSLSGLSDNSKNLNVLGGSVSDVSNSLSDLGDKSKNLNVLDGSVSDVSKSLSDLGDKSKNLNTLDNSIESITKTLDSIPHIPKELFDNLRDLKKIIESILEITNVDRDDWRGNSRKVKKTKPEDVIKSINSNLKTIEYVLSQLDNQNFSKDKLKDYIGTVKTLSDVISKLTSIKFESDSKTNLNNKKILKNLKNILSSMGSIVEYISKQKFQVDFFGIGQYTWAVGEVNKLVDKIIDFSETLTTKQLIKSELSLFYIKLLIGSFKLLVENIVKNILSTFKSDLVLVKERLTNKQKSGSLDIIEEFIEWLDYLELDLKVYIKNKIKFSQIKTLFRTLAEIIMDIGGPLSPLVQQINTKTINKNLGDIEDLINAIKDVNITLSELALLNITWLLIPNLLGTIENTIVLLGEFFKKYQNIDINSDDFDGIIQQISTIIDHLNGSKMSIAGIINISATWLSLNVILGIIEETLQDIYKRFNNLSDIEISESDVEKLNMNIEKLIEISELILRSKLINIREALKTSVSWFLLSSLMYTLGDALEKIDEFTKKYPESIKTLTLTNNIKKLEILSNKIREYLNSAISKKDVKTINGSFKTLQSILEKLINFNEFITKKLGNKKIVDLKPLSDFVDNLRKISENLKNTSKQISATLSILKNIILKLDLILVLLVLSVPIIAMFVVASPLILLGLGLVLIIFSLISKMILLTRGFITPQTNAQLIMLNILTGALILLVIEFIILGSMCEKFLDKYWSIVLTLLGMSVIILALGGIGYLIGLVTPGLLALAVGSIAVVISVLAILLIVAMLRLLQIIQLDPDKIRENVHIITSLVLEILSELSKKPDVEQNGEEPDRSIWSMLGIGLSNALISLCSVFTVVFAAIATLGILLIAGMLRLIQEISLNPELIKKNVNLIIGIVDDIINMLTDPEREPEKENEEWYETVWRGVLNFVHVLNPLLSVVKALFSAVTILLSVIAVGGVLLIAGMLRLLQDINLDRGKIMKNVDEVFSIVQSIIGKLGEHPSWEQAKDMGFFQGLIMYVAPSIGNLWNAITSIVYLAGSIISLGALMLIVKMLEYIGNIDTSAINRASENARLVLSVAQQICSGVFENKPDIEEKDQKPWWKNALSWIGGSAAKFVNSIIQLKNITGYIIMIGAISKLAEQINSLKIEGGIQASVRNAQTVMKGASQITQSILDSDLTGTSKKDLKKWTDSMENHTKMLKELKNLGKAEQDLSKSLSLEDIIASSSFASNSLGTLTNIIKSIGNLPNNVDTLKEKLSLIDSLNKSLHGIVSITSDDVKNTKELTDTYLRFINRLDQADLKRLNVTEKLMSHWALIAQAIDGDFDKLVLVLSEKMMPMLDRMDKTMEGVTKTQDEIIKKLMDPSLADTNINSSPDIPQNTGGSTATAESTNNNESIGTENISLASNNTAGENTQENGIGTNPILMSSTNKGNIKNSGEEIPKVTTTSNLNNTSRANKTRGIGKVRGESEDYPVYAILVGTQT